MSTVLLGLLDPGFDVTTILWQHTAGEFGGSFSMIPSLRSLSMASLTGFFQCNGTLKGLVWQTRSASGSIANLTGGPVIPCDFTCGQILNVEEE